jgi:hypothetical protein
MASGDFCTVSQVKHLLPIDKTIKEDDPLVQRLITAASTFIRNYVGDVLNSQAYTEIRDGTGTGKIILRHQPVTAVASVSIGPPSVNRVALVADVDYVFTRFGIQSLGRSFPRGVANIAIVYTAGYVAAPADIEGVAAKLAALRYKEAERIGQVTKSLAGQTISFDTSDIPKDVRLVLDQYKRVSQVPA